MEVLPTFFQAAPRTVAIEGPAAIARQIENRGLKRKFAEAFDQATWIQASYKEERSTDATGKLLPGTGGLSFSSGYRELEQEDGNKATPSGLRPLQLPDLPYLRAPPGPPRKKARMSDAAEQEQQQGPEEAEQQEQREPEEAEQQEQQERGQQVLNPEDQLEQVSGGGGAPPPCSDNSSLPSTSSSAEDVQQQAVQQHPDNQVSEEEKKVIPITSQWTTVEGKPVFRGHKIYPVEGDGRCLFRAVVLAFFVNRGQWREQDELRRLADELRHEAMNLMERRKSVFEWIVEGDFDTYVARMRRPCVWGGEPELVVLSHLLSQPIAVHVKMATDNTATQVVAEYGREFSSTGPPIRVLYDGLEHYSALALHEDLDSSYMGSETESETSSDGDYGTDLD